MASNKIDLVDVRRYDYTKNGGQITLVFGNGVTTRRHFSNIISDMTRVCALSKQEIKKGEVCLRVTIKQRGYGQYFLKDSSVRAALRGEFKKVDEESTLVIELRKFLNQCDAERAVMDKQDKELRKALREVKFNRSEVGIKMSKANQLLEVLSKEFK